MISILILAITFNCVILLNGASKSDKSVKFLISILSIYWLLSFVLRPLIFLISKSLNIATSSYDSRLAANPQLVMHALLQCFIGTLVFLGTFFYISRLKYKNPMRDDITVSTKTDFLMLNFGLIAGLVSLTIEYSDLRNPITKSLAASSSVFFYVLLWKRDFYGVSNAGKICSYSLGILDVLATSIFLQNSKGVILFPILIFAYRNWQFLYIKLSTLAKLRLVLIGILGVGFFNFLQLRKLGEVAFSQSTKYGDSLPWNLNYLLPISERFDSFARIVDANMAGVGVLGNSLDWFKYVVSALFWNPGSGRLEMGFGQLWNSEVTNLSIHDSYKSAVSLAPGIIAEGYIWSGYSSLIVECLLMALVFRVLSKGMERGILSCVLALGTIGNGTLFEAGIVSVSYKFTEAIKISMFTALLQLILNKRSKKF